MEQMYWLVKFEIISVLCIDDFLFLLWIIWYFLTPSKKSPEFIFSSCKIFSLKFSVTRLSLFLSHCSYFLSNSPLPHSFLYFIVSTSKSFSLLQFWLFFYLNLKESNNFNLYCILQIQCKPKLTSFRE